jgi:hypothetical protein
MPYLQTGLVVRKGDYKRAANIGKYPLEKGLFQPSISSRRGGRLCCGA